MTDRGTGPATGPVHNDPGRRDAEPSPGFPSSEELVAFLQELETTGVRRHRLAFTEVDARRTNGHIQGIAAKIEPAGTERRVTVYASLSDFPPGWGACLIEQATAGRRNGLGMEAMLLPQGRHPGGINICDDLLVVPMEHEGRDGRLYLYDIGHDPLYPRLVGAVDSSLTAELVWPSPKGADPEKASAAGIARMTESWAAPSRPIESRGRDPIANDGPVTGIDDAMTDRDGASESSGDKDRDSGRDSNDDGYRDSDGGEDDRYLTVVLSENRYLRFIELACDDQDRFGPTDWNQTKDMHGHDRWPDDEFVDNISLLNLRDDGWGLVVFSAEELYPVVHLQRGRTIDRITCYKLTFPERRDRETAADPGEPALEYLHSAKVRRFDTTKSDMFWPGFRWGASLLWTGERFALFMAEWFGNEVADSVLDKETGHTTPGGVMYVQFDTNLDIDPFGRDPIPGEHDADPVLPHFGAGHEANAARPPPWRRYTRIVRDILPVVRLAVVEGGRIVWGGLLLLAAVGVLALAIVLPALTWSLFLAGAGAILGVLGVGTLAVGLERWVDDQSSLRTKIWVAAALAMIAAGGGTILAFVAEWPIPTAVLSALAIVSAGIVYQLILRAAIDDRIGDRFPSAADQDSWDTTAGPSWVLPVLVAASVAVVALASRLRPDESSTTTWIGSVVALLVLLTAIKFLAWPVFRAGRSGRFSWVAALEPGRWMWLGVAVGAAVVGVALAIAGQTTALVVLGAWVVVIVASIWGSVEYKRPRPGERYLSRVLGAGLAATIISAAMAAAAVPDVLVAGFIVSVAVAAGLFVVWPGEASVLLVGAALLMSWGAADLDDDRPPDRPLVDDVAADDSTRWVVAIGDSFISGEGAGAFYADTNHPGVNVCRRAPTAWPDLAAAHLAGIEETKPAENRRQVRLVSFACSGATIADIADQPQHPDATGILSGNRSQFEELDAWLDDLAPSDQVAYVLVSAGGNDAGFARVIAACLTPVADCVDVIDDFRQRAGPVETDLERLLMGLEARWPDPPIGDASDPRPIVIVNPYLDPFGAVEGPRCGGIRGRASLITAAEVGRLRIFSQELNGRIQRAVANYLDGDDRRLSVRYNSRGAGVDGNLCRGSDGDRPVGQNWLVLQPPDRVGDGQLAPFRALVPSSTWFLGSVHPNEAGHRDIGDTVCGVITRFEEDGAFALGCGGSRVISAALAPVREEDLVCDPAGEAGTLGCRDTVELTERWVERHQRTAGRLLGGAAVVGLLGGMLLGSASAHDPRIRRRRPAPVPSSSSSSSSDDGSVSIDLRS